MSVREVTLTPDQMGYGNAVHLKTLGLDPDLVALDDVRLVIRDDSVHVTYSAFTRVTPEQAREYLSAIGMD